MNDLDLEELESRLYSQVYHGLNDETAENNLETYSGVNSLSKPTDDMRKSGRYFGPWTPGSRIQTRNPPKQTNLKANKDSCKSDGYYYKNYSKQRQPDISIDQVVVVSPNRPIVFMNSRERNKAKWKAKLKEKMKRRRANRQRDRLNQQKDSDVITLSDSDDNDNSCVVVEKKWPLLSVVDSDDESKLSKEKTLENTDNNLPLKSEKSDAGNAHLSDDVIFVEPEVIPPVIINIDEESETLEKASSTSSDTISITTTPRKERVSQRLHKERRELLSTPDSASNDFITNSGVELNQGNFNFSLHGSDFHSGEFLKPAPKNNETCETESSSSTTDIHSANLMKTIVFNEVDFPKDDIFSENNLESFGNFITPLRKIANVTNAQSSPARSVESQPKNVYTSDSSSESDLEESQIDIGQKKNLPELSPMIANQDINRDAPQVPKKIKNLSALCSKYDLLDSVVSESSVKEIKQKSSKKKKKTKKKKQTGSENNEEIYTRDNTEENSTETDATGTENIDDEPKRKKKKSQQIEGENLENQFKKKCNSLNINETNDEGKSAAKTAEDQELGKSKQNDNYVEPNMSLSQSKRGSSELDAGESDINSEDFNLKKVKVESSEVDTVDKATTSTENVDNIKNTQEIIPNVKIFSDSQLDDLVIIDETFNESTLEVSSDSESVLSALNENSDIQFNITEIDNNRLSPANQFQDCKNFSVKDLQQKMSNDPNLWRILETDRSPSIRNKGRRCNRCKQWGHMAIRCPNKVEIKCSLCGAKGHFEPRCPNKICTQCGKPSPYSTTYCNSCFKLRNYQCSICSMTGHLPDSCPDLWRRYHLTIEEGPLITFTGPTLKENDKLWCSGCAQSGHLEHSCNFYKPIYPPSDPSIKSYDEVYHKEISQHDTQISQLRNRQIPPISPQQLYYGANYGNYNNQYYQRFDRNGRNFNEAYGPMNSNLNPFIGEVFIKNQQNYYPPVAQNVMQFPETSYSMNLNPYAFENVLPNYISFESNASQPPTNFRDLPNPNMRLLRDTIKSSHTLPKRNAIFFSSTAVQLQHFINDELHRLGKLSILSNKLVKELKRRQVPAKRHVIEREEYYETLNMLLFGVMNMIDGKMHLERLKKFKRDKLKHKVSAEFRRLLHKSYCYIFGRDKHIGVHYGELLRKI